MSITHDPGPTGPSGEGEFVLFCIFLSYFVSFFLVTKTYWCTKNNHSLTEEIYVEDATSTQEIWLQQTEYNPSIQFRQQFIQYASCGLIVNGDYDDVTNNSHVFRLYYFLSGVNWLKVCILFGVWGLIWLFLVCLGLMGTGFKLLGGKDAARMFDVVDNPISGLMIGILATVFVQSSSTTTSIIVGLVGADEMSVTTAIPMIMGVNIGTSVTNTLVSLSHFGNPEELQIGFAAATIHDCFNFLTVIIMLPIQILTHMFSHITYAMAKNANACDDSENDCDKQEFIKPYLKPYYNDIAKYDKKVATYVSQNFCNGRCDDDQNILFQTQVTNTVCVERDCHYIDSFKNSWLKDDVLKSTRLPAYVRINDNHTSTSPIAEYLLSCMDCNHTVVPFWNHLNNTLNNITSLALENPNEYVGTVFQVCGDMDYDLCDKRLLKGGIFYRDWNLSDETAGALCVWFSLSGICTVLYLIVQSLNVLVRGSAAKWLRKAVAYNGYVSILIGMFVTIMVQSSSITTSVLTPLVAIGLIPLNDMLPLTLGANIGTTVTGILAATVVTSNPVSAWQVALSHLLFNLFGIIIWYPLEKTRQVPIRMATYLGDQTAKNKYFPLIYVSTTFFIIPGIVYGLTVLI